jgi:hypothetical protein
MALPPPPAAPTPEEEKLEGELATFELELKGLRCRVELEGPIFIDRETGKEIARVSWREWRIIKTFFDQIYGEYRAIIRARR